MTIATEVKDFAFAIDFRKLQVQSARRRTERRLDERDYATNACERASLIERIRRYEYPFDEQAS